jgi:hypothetical protein
MPSSLLPVPLKNSRHLKLYLFFNYRIIFEPSFVNWISSVCLMSQIGKKFFLQPKLKSKWGQKTPRRVKGNLQGHNPCFSSLCLNWIQHWRNFTQPQTALICFPCQALQAFNVLQTFETLPEIWFGRCGPRCSTQIAYNIYVLKINILQIYIKSNLCVTTTLGIQNLWSLLTGCRCSEVALCYEIRNRDPQNSGRCRQVVVIRRWSLTQI